MRHVTLLLLNQLRDLPHNAFVKTFASRQVEKRKAFALLNNFTGLSTRLVTFLQGLQAIWSLTEGGTMNEILTPERVMEIGEVWKKTLLQSMTPKELDMYLPEYKQTLLAQGLGQGLEQGIALAKRETVQAMAARKFDLAVIADLTGLTLAQVNAILADQTTAA